MLNRPPRVAAIHDLSGFGRCSLSVILPVLSAMGVQACPVPTAVLSTHTMFRNYTFRDLTRDIQPIAAHWKAEKIGFDAIYTGYLGSFEQLELVSEFIDEFRTPENIVFIDPVMADNGKMYPGFTPEFARAMAGLCGKADMIVPNLTEAAFLLNRPCRLEGYTESEIKDLLKALAELGPKQVVLTGVHFHPNELGVMGYHAAKNEFFHYFHRRIDVAFHGTGDIFSSAALGGLVRGLAPEQALKLAADYTVESIECTLNSADHVWYGVEFERALPGLIDRMRKQGIMRFSE